MWGPPTHLISQCEILLCLKTDSLHRNTNEHNKSHDEILAHYELVKIKGEMFKYSLLPFCAIFKEWVTILWIMVRNMKEKESGS